MIRGMGFKCKKCSSAVKHTRISIFQLLHLGATYGSALTPGALKQVRLKQRAGLWLWPSWKSL